MYCKYEFCTDKKRKSEGYGRAVRCAAGMGMWPLEDILRAKNGLCVHYLPVSTTSDKSGSSFDISSAVTAISVTTFADILQLHSSTLATF